MGKAGQSCFSHLKKKKKNVSCRCRRFSVNPVLIQAIPQSPASILYSASWHCFHQIFQRCFSQMHACTHFLRWCFSGNGPAFAWVHLRGIDTVRVLRQLCHLVSSLTLIAGRKGKLIHRSVGFHPHGCTICRNYSNCIQGATKVSGTDYSL